jgi:hypothetical protein
MFACGLLSGYDSSLAFSYPKLQMLLTFRDFNEALLVVLRPSVVGGLRWQKPTAPVRCVGCSVHGAAHSPKGMRRPSDDGQSLSKASLTFSPACLMLLTL